MTRPAPTSDVAARGLGRRHVWLACGGALLGALVLLPSILGRVCAWQGERRLTEVLPGTWHLSGLYPGVAWLLGNLGTIQVDGLGVTLHSGLRLEHVHLEFEDAHATPLGLSSVGVIHCHVDILADDLNDSVRRRSHASFVPHLTFADGRITVGAEQKTLHLLIPSLRMEGSVEIRDGVLVYFVPADLEVGSAKAGARSLEWLGQAINPLVDTRTLPYGLMLRQVTVASAGLHVDADAHPAFPLPTASGTPPGAADSP